MVGTTDADDARAKVWSLIKDVKVALFVTHSDSGALHSRPMAAMAGGSEDDELWFASRKDTPKLAEIADESHVLLAYSEPKSQNYVSISGRASIVGDTSKAEEHWSEDMRVWFPDGPTDASLTLIRVAVDGAEYWDAPSSAWIHAVGYAKARLTGEPPRDVGDNQVVSF